MFVKHPQETFGDYITNTPYEIFGDADSGHLRIMTERDRNVLASARTIMQRFGKALPTSKALSGKATLEEINNAQPIAQELKSLTIYNTPTSSEVEQFIISMNALSEEELANYPITIYVKGAEDRKIKMSSTVKDFLTKYHRKNEFLVALAEAYQSQKPKTVSFQVRTALGRLNVACDRAGIARIRPEKRMGA